MTVTARIAAACSLILVPVAVLATKLPNLGPTGATKQTPEQRREAEEARSLVERAATLVHQNEYGSAALTLEQAIKLEQKSLGNCCHSQTLRKYAVLASTYAAAGEIEQARRAMAGALSILNTRPKYRPDALEVVKQYSIQVDLYTKAKQEAAADEALAKARIVVDRAGLASPGKSAEPPKRASRPPMYRPPARQRPWAYQPRPRHGADAEEATRLDMLEQFGQ